MPRTQPPRKDKNRVPRDKRALPQPKTNDAERVAKVIARAGLGSRREIETWIEAGRIAVNGIVLTSPAFTVTEKDSIQVDGQPLPERERTRLYLYHKPKGVVTTNRDPEGRTTLFEILPKGLPRLVSVGRLDLNSEGLLLLTNDGGLARALELPETGWLRRYRVRANGAIDQAKLDALMGGITVEGIEYGPIEATLDRVQGANAWISVSLREGKNREVRNVLAALGMRVNRLIRVSYGPFQLGDVPENGIEEVRTRILRDQLGEELSAAAGVDFDAPLFERAMEEAQRFTPRPEDLDDRPVRRGPTRRETVAVRHDTEIEHRGRSRHPHGDGDTEGGAFRVRSRRKDERETVSAGTVADRKGRQVKVERFVPEPQDERFAERSDPRRPARPAMGQKFGARPSRPEGRFRSDEERPRAARSEDGGPKRGPARFQREDSRDGAPARGPRREGVGASPHKPIFGRGRPDGAERGVRREGGTGKPGGFRSDRAERPKPFSADRPERAPRRDDRPAYDDKRPPRREGGAGKPGGFRSDRAERPKPFSADRPERAPRRDDRPAYDDKRPPRREGSAGKPGGFRSDRAERPKPFSADRPERAPRRDEPGRSPRPRGGGFPERGRSSDDVGFSGARPQRPDAPRGRGSFGDRPPREGNERGGFGGGKPRSGHGTDKPRGGFGAGAARERPAGKPGFAGGRPRAGAAEGGERTGFRPGGKAGPGGPKRPGFGGPKGGARPGGAPRGKPSGPRKRD
ncbi:pseudouridine synthase [Roseixanthobacter glucoisosaccharinicivorans]|uniref:pseudouridine synthase n=1 Tax=Roseixanthobacter glucoisosaccharinicivorans TaxID=3119923 RepID=UPI00372A7B9E